ncbi:uncharacterized protein LOC121740058 [Aricia agestis]|uniref:uncharacterized protein LOC121740058 n=1 Tax=Aricia agestis TaxID=91739 RepID=UPI001C208648|nr:uncharacterized protein LOC121740058 [Aricia agestis]
MPTKILVLCSLLLLQCTLGQCTDSRIEGFTSFPTIPSELLALKNYGAVDFLSSPRIESMKPYIPSIFPASSVPEVACENRLINSNPYAIGVTNFKVPGNCIAPPVNYEMARIIDQVIPQPPLILETPITLLNTPLEQFSINYPIETSYELSPYTFSIQNSLNPVVSNLYVEEAPILITSFPSIQAPAISNIVELNPVVSPISNTLGISPPVLNAVLEVPSSLFTAPVIELPAILQVVPPSLGPVIDVLSPMLCDVPVAIEPPVFLNSFTVPTPVASVELPVVENIPTYSRFQIAPTYSRPQIPILSSESIASTIANIKAIFPSLPSFTPSSRVRNLDGIKNSELSASRGNGLFITSSSPKRPSGISIRSENTYQGPVSVSGVLPFLGTVGFSGSLPSSGYGTVNYICGAGNVGMLPEAPNILNSLYPRP